MIDTPKPPIDDDDESDAAKEPSTDSLGGRKIPRKLIITFAIFTLILLFAVGGIIKALVSDTQDPETIKFPGYASKTLADEQPAADKAATAPVDPSQPVSAPEDTQSESTLDLNAPVAPSPAESTENKVDEKKPEAGPQSMIRWDRLPQAARATTDGDKPQIAIVIDDMGLNRRNSQAVVSLPAALTLAYLPYAGNLPQQAQAARDRGHELIVHMPMEPDDLKQNNPGPDALLTSNSSEENVRRLDKNLAKFTGYIGMNNHMGSRLTANPTLIRPILQDLKRRGLWFLDSKTIGNSVAGKIAGEIGVPYVERDVFLDNTASVGAVLQQLRQAQAVAKRRGYAVAIGHPHDATIAALKQWLPQAQAQGYELVSLSTVIAERFPQANVPQYAQLKKSEAVTENAIEPAAGSMTIPAFGLHATALQPVSQLR